MHQKCTHTKRGSFLANLWANGSELICESFVFLPQSDISYLQGDFMELLQSLHAFPISLTIPIWKWIDGLESVEFSLITVSVISQGVSHSKSLRHNYSASLFITVVQQSCRHKRFVLIRLVINYVIYLLAKKTPSWCEVCYEIGRAKALHRIHSVVSLRCIAKLYGEHRVSTEWAPSEISYPLDSSRTLFAEFECLAWGDVLWLV